MVGNTPTEVALREELETAQHREETVTMTDRRGHEKSAARMTSS